MRFSFLTLLWVAISLFSCSQETRQEQMFSPATVDSSRVTQINEISRAIDRGKEEPEWFLKRARLYLSIEKPQAAFHDLSAALALEPALGEAYFLKAKILLGQQQYQESMKMMMQANAFNFYTPESEAILAETYVGLRLYERALNHSAKAVSLRPDEGKYYVLLAQAQAGTGDTARALYNLGRALQKDSTSLPAHRELSSIYMTQRRFSEALPMIQAGIHQQPKDGFWWYQLGLNLLEQRRTDSALASLTKAVALQPANAQAYVGVGEAWYRKRQYSLALQHFLKAQELGLNLKDDTRWLLATCLEWTGQAAAAQPHYVFLAKKYPQNPRYAVALRRANKPIRRTILDTIRTRSVF